ncbi:MAG: membrane protein insertion efficiency factor YidD [Deltaproteobacteria bacterium]|jgi:putative membrane protein insertion efficiency factor|nr:membrane protein insertion efficiency factor YidD [Deltaproteobacteria bacterium]
MAKVFILFIKLYQKYLSPLKRHPTCRFRPTCSSYAISALKNRGFIVGTFYSLWRVLRCNPFVKGGYDPPPEKSESGSMIMRKVLPVILLISVLFFALTASGQNNSDKTKKSEPGVEKPVAEKKVNSVKPGKTARDIAGKDKKIEKKGVKAAKPVSTADGTAIAPEAVAVKDGSTLKDGSALQAEAKKRTELEQAKTAQGDNDGKIDKGNDKSGQVLTKANRVHSVHTRFNAPASIPAEKDQRLIYENSLYKAEFTTYGGVFKSFILKYKSYREEVVPKKKLKKQQVGLVEQQIDMIKTWSPAFLPFVFEMKIQKQAESVEKHTFYYVANLGNRFQQIEDRIYQQKWKLIKREDSQQKSELTFELETDNPCTPEKLKAGENCFPARIKKKYTLYEGRYDLNLDLLVENISDEKINIDRLVFQVSSLHEGEAGRGFFNPVSTQKEAICYHEDGVSVQPFETIRHGKSDGGCMGGCSGGGCGGCACRRTPSSSSSFAQGARWAGIDTSYFLLAIIKNYPGDDGGCNFEAYPIRENKGFGLIISRLIAGGRKDIEPGKVFYLPYKIFSGPKDTDYLNSVNVTEKIPSSPNQLKEDRESTLSESVDFGILGIIGKPMIWLLKRVYVFFGNWGLSIIFLTILIKLLTLYWTTKSMRSMKKMAALKPKIDALQEKHGNDKAKLNEEMMALYKNEGVNPLGGCLPMFLQMPIYIAWYQALMASVELYRAPLFGWINDLTSTDPYYVLPVLMGIFMFLQQKMSPTTQENQQAKMMMYFMPIMFTTIMLFLPSGLTLYILTNTILGMVHQWYMNHTDDVAA